MATASARRAYPVAASVSPASRWACAVQASSSARSAGGAGCGLPPFEDFQCGAGVAPLVVDPTHPPGEAGVPAGLGGGYGVVLPSGRAQVAQGAQRVAEQQPQPPAALLFRQLRDQFGHGLGPARRDHPVTVYVEHPGAPRMVPGPQVRPGGGDRRAVLVVPRGGDSGRAGGTAGGWSPMPVPGDLEDHRYDVFLRGRRAGAGCRPDGPGEQAGAAQQVDDSRGTAMAERTAQFGTDRRQLADLAEQPGHLRRQRPEHLVGDVACDRTAGLGRGPEPADRAAPRPGVGFRRTGGRASASRRSPRTAGRRGPGRTGRTRR